MSRDFYSEDYGSARARFRDAAADLGCALEAHALAAKGPNGETLTIDVAISPGAGNDRTLLISSGIHGVEGFFGSAVQLRLLHDWARQPELRPPFRWVMAHALNPHGFAWRRRVNEDNVDLNRNLLVDGQAFRGSPVRYASLDPLLNPRHAPTRWWDPVRLKILAAVARHGLPALKQAVASGQYDYPLGLFYGGSQPTQTRRILDANFARWLGDSARAFHVDLHTGLGRWGSCKLLLDQPIDSSQQRWLSDCFGAGSYETGDAADVAYAINGCFGLWGLAHAGNRDYLYAAAEVGTYAAPRVLAALRAENQARHWGQTGDAATERAKQRLMEAFCPRSAHWRQTVLAHGLRIVQQAVAGLLRESPQATAARGQATGLNVKPA